MSLRLAFMGSPDFAVPALEAIASAGHEIACVYAQPPRPAGRGQRERPCPVHACADSHGWPVRNPESFRGGEVIRDFRELGLDVAVVAAYGLLLPTPALAAPRLGCVNIHASLLPRWRGAAPIQRAILAGDDTSGISIMQMDAGLDTGPVLLARETPIADTTTAQQLHDALAALGAETIVEALAGLEAGGLEATPQPTEGVTYASKLSRAEARLDWSHSAVELERQVRAFTPWPGAWFEVDGERIKVLAAETVKAAMAAPGTVVDQRLTIATAWGGFRPTRVQRPGKAAMTAEEMLRGRPIAPGSVLA